MKVKGQVKRLNLTLCQTMYVFETTPMYLYTTFCALKSIVKMGQLYVNMR